MNFFGNENYRFYYFPILKNASSWGHEFFTKNFNFVYKGGTKFTLDEENKKAIIFFRNPVERWFSGVTQWFMLNRLNFTDNTVIIPEDYKIDEVLMKLIFTVGGIEDHSKTQMETMTNLNFYRCHFFDVGASNFKKNLVTFLETEKKVKVIYQDIPKINTTTEDVFKNNIYSQIKNSYTNNEKLKNSILMYLQPDIDFYHKLYREKIFVQY